MDTLLRQAEAALNTALAFLAAARDEALTEVRECQTGWQASRARLVNRALIAAEEHARKALEAML